MARYINIEDVTFKGVAVFDDNLELLVPLSEVRKALQMTPTANVVPKRDYDILKSLITHKEEEAYNKGYADAVSEIFEEIRKRAYSERGFFVVNSDIDDFIAELKNKYTEGGK